jgi:Domain of unknown function (DUF222)/HNH endonuclease
VIPSALDRLDAAIGQLDLAVDDRDLAAALALRDRLDARIASAVQAMDAAGLWDAVGATSMTAWIADRGRMARPRAAVMSRVARLVARLPVTAAAWADGHLSTGHVETICAFLTDATVEVFARHEHALIPVLEPLSVAEVAAAMRAWRAHLDSPDPAPTAPSSLHASRTLAGRARVDGDLDADTGELLLTALRVATQAAPDTDGEPARVPAQRRADALGDICRFYLDHQEGVSEGQRHRPHLNLVFDMVPAPDGPGFHIDDARTIDGYPIDRVTAGRYLCDSLLYRVLVRGKSAILDYGRATRAVPPPLWNVLLLRDQHCRWKGCDRPGAWCEAHHVIWWEKGGTTDIANLVLLCSRHHHIAHRPGWTAELAPDGTLHVTDPWGVTRTTRPPATGPPLPFAASPRHPTADTDPGRRIR